MRQDSGGGFRRQVGLVLLCSLFALFGAAYPQEDAFFSSLRREKDPVLGRSLLALSRRTLVTYFKTGKVSWPREVPKSLSHRAGLFVTLLVDGRNRGCMGSLHPTEKDLAAETVKNTLAAALEDPLHPPLSSRDLPRIRIVISVVGNPEHLAPGETRDPLRFGLLVRSGGRAGVLLPAEARTFKGQVKACKRKAGIREGAFVEKIAFETVSFRE
ncbi:MAG: AMMECR1 family protein [Armatimonadetes bacterium]|nr:AMMECR1 family protein [Armatimonadota bacterium]